MAEMSVDQIYQLASRVHAAMPTHRIAQGLQDKDLCMEAPYEWCERLEAILLEGGIDQIGAVVLGDTFASYVGLSLSTRFGNLDQLYEEALTAVNNQAGGFSARWNQHEVWAAHYLPTGDLTVAQIACSIDWWLCREEHGEEL